MRHRQISVPFVALTLILAAAVIPASGQYNVLYNFGVDGSITDPCSPQNSGIIAQGQDGNLYSTTNMCGQYDGGTMFEVTPSGTFSLNFTFPNGGPANPFSGLTLDPASGNFYGTTTAGGTVGDGVLFSITPAGSLTVLHSFTGGTDGYTAWAPPIIATDRNLYGTSRRGGNTVSCGNGCGVVWKMTPSGALVWSHEFDLPHGFGPFAPLVEGADGNFYGTTNEGGTGQGFGQGVVFKITPAGKPAVLHSFVGPDGQYPQGPLIQGSDGNFYGTTIVGGANGYGVVFKITPSGSLTVLHSMSQATDGGNPYAGLVQASDGNFYGVNQSGGLNGGGTLFKITPKGILTVLHNFDGTHGAQPFVTLIQHTNGTLYGDTFVGGTGSQQNCGMGSCGVFFSYNAGLKPFIKLLSAAGKVGDKIGILGQAFNNTSVVKFNGVKATSITVSGTTFIMATVPVGTLDGYVTVTTGGTTLKSLQKFLVHDSWGTGAAMPVGAVASCAALMNGQIYVVGGLNGSPLTNNQIYNPTTNKWSAGTALGNGLSNQACAAVNGEVYEFGGTTNVGSSQTNAVWAYNPSTKTWASKIAMPTARQDIVAVVENGLVYVIGGYDGNRLRTVEAYNPANDTWISEASLLVAQSGDVGGLIGTQIVISGGAGQSTDTGDTESYSARNNSWTSLALDTTLRNNPCGGAISGSLYVAGGADRTGPALKVVRAFMPSTDSWTTLSSIPQATVAPASAVYNGQLFCFGGWTAFQGTILNNLQIYQP
jgi:uncharacterized repeat protein (TIGR03803 family)